MLTTVVQILIDLAGRLGYGGIVVLMFLESSFFPFPSEVVMVPAGYLASLGRLNLWGVMASGILGSVLGAGFNYYLGFRFGRRFLVRFGKYMFLSEDKLEQMERLFERHGEIITFTGRLLPGVRQYISFPPGVARMSVTRFMVFTGLGAGLWVVILSLVGYIVGQNQQLVRQYMHQITIGLVVTVVVLVGGYVVYHRRRERVEQKEN